MTIKANDRDMYIKHTQNIPAFCENRNYIFDNILPPTPPWAWAMANLKYIWMSIILQFYTSNSITDMKSIGHTNAFRVHSYSK